MQVGFCVRVRPDQVEIQFVGRRPEGPRSLVSHARLGRLHAVLMGRLTYQDDLVDQLTPEMAPAERADAALALAAYRRWGAAGLARLEGTFALVIWDGDRRLLLGSRDPFGGYPLFWARLPDGLAVGCCLRPLLSLLPRRSVNLDYLAEYLALPGAMASEPPTQQCAYEGVYRVRPGCIFQARLSDGQAREQPYWDWIERVVDPGTDRLEALGDLVAAGLRRAVGEHLRGRVAAHVSGGMDSTAVALLARDLLRDAPGRPPVHALSLVYEKLGELARETPYLESALNQPGLVPHRTPADDLLDYDGYAEPPPHDEPFGMLFRLSPMAKLVETAAEVGADTLLTGCGADGLIDQPPHHLADLVRRGRLRSAWRGARAWGRAYNRSVWHFLWKFGLAPCLPVSWSGPQQAQGAIAPWVRREFASSQMLGERAHRHLRRRHPSTHLSVMLSQLEACQGDCVSWYVAAPHGVAHVHPFLGPRFVRLCLGIHGRFRQEPGAQKPLLTHAMRDVLPDLIRNRRSKGHYNAVVHLGLARNLPALEALIHRAPVDDLNVFDKEALIRSLQQAALGFIPPGSLDKLHLTLSWLRWFTLQEEGQSPRAPAVFLRVYPADRSGAGDPTDVDSPVACNA